MTEFEALGHDVRYLAELARSKPELWGAVAGEQDRYRAGYLLVVSDYFWQIVQYAGAIQALLAEELDLPLIPVQRALFEAAVGLGYLRAHPDCNKEATILLAYTHLKDQEEYSHQVDLVEERRTVLSRMPPDAVAEAQRRVNARRSWSGKTIKEMASTSRLRGYDLIYGRLSGPTHANRAGRYFRILPTETGVTVHTGKEITPTERETSANFARRVLHAAFKFMWSDLGGPHIQLRTTDPEEWLKKQPPIEGLTS